MPNHFAVQILCRLNGRDEDEDPDFSGLTDANLCDLVLPMPDEVKGEVPGVSPNEPWRIHWGTKWGTYNTRVEALPGDNNALRWVSFESAWGPPHRHMMRDIYKYLESEYRLVAEITLYFEPYDESYTVEVVKR